MKTRTLGFALVTMIAVAAAPLAAQVTQQAGGVTCVDGTKSTATGRGACSGHGGVAKPAAAKTVKRAEKLENRAKGAIAKCKDGTYSHAKSLQGACSSHGGVDQVMKKG